MRQRVMMLSRVTGIVASSWVMLSLVPLPCFASGQGPRAANKPELIVVHVKVTDKKTGDAIDDADVLVKWTEGEEEDSRSETTNSQGNARLKDVPRGKVVIDVIARGYRTERRSVDLRSEGQPIKIELNKEHVEEATPPRRPAGVRSSGRRR